jgi:CheY-like chemotaxis protein
MRLEIHPGQTISDLSASPTAGVAETADEFLLQGTRAAEAGRRSEARVALSRAVEIDPSCESAWMWLASISAYPEELYRFLANALTVNPENEKAREWFAVTAKLLASEFVRKGTEARDASDLQAAVTCYEQALEYDPRSVPAMWELACLTENEDLRAKMHGAIVEIDPGHNGAVEALKSSAVRRAATLLAQAKAAAATGDLSAAMELLDHVTREHPENKEGWMLTANLAARLETRVAAFRRVLEIDPDDHAARACLDALESVVSSQIESGGSQPNEHENGSGVGPAESDKQDPALEIGSEPAAEADSSPVDDFWEPEVSGEMAEQTAQGEAEASPQPRFIDLRPAVADEAVTAELNLGDLPATEEPSEPNLADESAGCPYCEAVTDEQAVACGACGAVLTLADLEMLLSNRKADVGVLRPSVQRMESERLRRDLSRDEFVQLGVGHLNLRNFQFGYDALYEASRLFPDDVVLRRQVDSLLIRLEEIRRQEEVNGSRLKGKTILVVDDSPTVRKLIAGKLEKSGHEVFCSNDGVEALEVLESLQPDLILLDINMPRMDGYQVCKLIRTNPATRDVPVVMISGKDGFFDKVRGKMAGTTGYITKPFGPETLMKAIESYLQNPL